MSKRAFRQLKKHITSERQRPKVSSRPTETVITAKIFIITLYDKLKLLGIVVLKRNTNEMVICSVLTPAVAKEPKLDVVDAICRRVFKTY